uniref:Linolenate hydroperoxide lyase n=1 Tax=Fritillaria cirrhosa TaxID=108544 RepID=A0A1L7H7Y7_9LILI|nr:linolenate hydroperoxide lyase [Fritillaria cirrhosa]
MPLPVSCSVTATPTLPTKPMPGSYGLPLVGPLKDRLDYFWFQGPETFFKARTAAYKSTVFRTNIPPNFFGVNPRVVAVLDCSSFSTLFDNTLIDKSDVLIGPYCPSPDFTGGTRVGVYLDTTDPKHSRIKNFCFELLKRSSRVWVSEFLLNLDALLTTAEADIASSGSSSLLVPLQKCIFNFLCKSLVGADPKVSPEIADNGFIMLDKWLAFQILPTQKIGAIPQPFEELLLHSFPFPSFLVSSDYKKLYDFVDKEGREAVKLAEDEYGLTRSDAINNILFVLGFNAFGGFSVFLPTLITTVGRDKSGLRDRLRAEVRSVMADKTELDFKAVVEMELLRSTVYEVLRMNPPVPLQYGRARSDFLMNSHESSYKVEKGELLCGYQPLVMRDPVVFNDPDTFMPDRFTGVKGKELLQYLFWSNGPQTATPTADDKQCAAKDFVVFTACMLVAQILNKYDDFECDDGNLAFSKLKKKKTESVIV